jgi:hypothetical protein
MGKNNRGLLVPYIHSVARVSNANGCVVVEFKITTLGLLLLFAGRRDQRSKV